MAADVSRYEALCANAAPAWASAAKATPVAHRTDKDLLRLMVFSVSLVLGRLN